MTSCQNFIVVESLSGLFVSAKIYKPILKFTINTIFVKLIISWVTDNKGKQSLIWKQNVNCVAERI